VLDGERMEALFEKRDDLATNAGASTVHVEIGGVFAPGLAELLQIGAELRAAKAEQRADYLPRDRVNAGETCDSRPAEEVGENGFGLIVGSVSGSDESGVLIGDQLGKELVARTAGSVFEVRSFAECLGLDICAIDVKRKIVGKSELGDELLISVRSAAAQAVIEVRNGKHQAALPAEFQEQAEQGHGIGTTGNRNTHAVAWPEQPLGRYGRSQSGDEIGFHATYRISRWGRWTEWRSR